MGLFLLDFVVSKISQYNTTHTVVKYSTYQHVYFLQQWRRGAVMLDQSGPDHVNIPWHSHASLCKHQAATRHGPMSAFIVFSRVALPILPTSTTRTHITAITSTPPANSFYLHSVNVLNSTRKVLLVTTCSKMSQSAFPGVSFCDLPTEMREEVYSYIFQTHRISRVHVKRSLRKNYNKGERFTCPSRILAVDKTCHAEFCAILEKYTFTTAAAVVMERSGS